MTDEVKTPEATGTEQAESRLPRTQEELDALVQGRLDRERKKFADYDTLKKTASEFEKQKQAAMTESERKDAAIKDYEAKIADLTNQLTDREAKVLRVQMLEEEGLPTSWAERVRGTTPEDIKADVAELKKLLGVKKQPVGGSAAPADVAQPNDINATIRQALGY